MLPYLIAGVIGYGISKLFDDNKAPKYVDGGEVKDKDDVNVPLYHGTIKEIWKNSEYESYLYVTYDFEFAKSQALDRAIGEDGTPIVVKIYPNQIKKYRWEVDDDMGIYRDLHTWQDSYNKIGSFVIIGEFDIDNFQIIDIDRFEEDKAPKYTDGGSVLLAPNGKPSNLTPEQYKLVRTPEFKEWFGDWENDPENSSKVVDENGEPLVVYHGSNAKFNFFDLEESRFGYFYFAVNKEYAEKFGEVKSYFINARKIKDATSIGLKKITIDKAYKLLGFKSEPTYTYTKDEFWQHLRFSNKINRTLRWNNYDGVKYIEDFKEDKSNIQTEAFAVLNPNQIKLADGTNTTFDGNNTDIRFMAGGELKRISAGNYIGKYKGVEYQIINIPEQKVWYWKVGNEGGDDWYYYKKIAIEGAKEFIDSINPNIRFNGGGKLADNIFEYKEDYYEPKKYGEVSYKFKNENEDEFNVSLTNINKKQKSLVLDFEGNYSWETMKNNNPFKTLRTLSSIVKYALKKLYNDGFIINTIIYDATEKKSKIYKLLIHKEFPNAKFKINQFGSDEVKLYGNNADIRFKRGGNLK